jgi:oligopeptide ABC transporter (permease)
MTWLKKLTEAAVFLLLLTLVSFMVVKLAPGDAARSLLRMDTIAVTGQDIEAQREQLGLNAPIWEQYLSYIANVARLNFGTSTMSSKPVVTELANAFPGTLLLAGWSLVVALVITAVLGIFAARNAGKWQDRLAQGFCLVASSLPAFWLGLLLLTVFAVGLGWLPSQGSRPGGLILPVVCLAIVIAPPYVKVFRGSLVEAQEMDFVRASRSRGLHEATVFGKHVLRASLIPLVTIMGMSLGSLLGGTVIVEKIFAIPGIGKLALDALTKRDYAVIQAFILFIGIVVFLINALVDLSYRWLDPAIALKERKKA